MQSGMEVRRRRRRDRKACDLCRRRKSRCDVAERVPCSVCEKSRSECRTTPVWPAAQGSNRANQHQEQSSPSRSSLTDHHELAVPVDDTRRLDTARLGTMASSGTPSDHPTVTSGLERDGLSQFYQRGVNSTKWWVFDEIEYIRLAYIGTPVSNLAHLVSLKQHSNTSLHLPFPPMRPPVPWKPAAVQEGTGSTDIANDTACFPAREIRDSMVDAFFEKIHPGFPVIEESMFRRQYADPRNPPPLLLFQAVLLAGAHVCDHPMVVQSRMIVKRTLFRRASMLFHMNHENDRLHMAQAALLFTWHLENADNVCGGSYFWVGIAFRIAFGMGLHRDLSPRSRSRLPAWERRLYRRTWWTLFQVEIFSCLEHGRPCIIKLNDTDQPPLEPEDFIEGEEGEVNQSVNLEYCQQTTKLCYIVLDLLEINSPGQILTTLSSMVQSIEASLAEFAMNLPPASDFWSCQLRMHYNLVLLHLHRRLKDDNDESLLPAAQQLHSAEVSNEAAQAILFCMETMVHRGWIGQCSSTGVSAVMAAAIQITVDARAALSRGSIVLAHGARDRLIRLLHCVRELECFWPSAGAVYRLFDELSEELQQSARTSILPTSRSAEMAQSSSPDDGMPLPNALEFLDFDMPTGFVSEEWMNDAELFGGLLMQ